MPGKQRASGYGTQKSRYQEMKADNDQLREALALEKRSLDEWLEMPEQMRDRLAAEAFFFEKGRRMSAAVRLGFAPTGSDVKNKELFAALFETPGCRAIIERDLEDAEANRKPLLARMIYVGLNGDDDAAVRATQLVARMAGWQLTPETVVNNDNRKVTLLQILGTATPEGDQHKEPEALEADFLAHTPGEPVRVSSDDNIDAMLEAAQS